MYKYAQIDESGHCVSVSFLTSEVNAPHMIPLSDEDDVQPGDIWDGSTWTRPNQPPAPDPFSDTITQLQLALAELAEAYEQDMTTVQLALAELAELITGGE